jgi:hypothetical protein
MPIEEVAVFVQKAKEAAAMVEAMRRLSNGELVPEWLWQRMRHGSAAEVARYPHDHQLETLFFLLYARLEMSNMLRVRLGLENGPKLHIVPQFGFIHAVTLTLVQILCRAKGVYKCEECGTYYERSNKPPGPKDRNFCEHCHGGKDKHGRPRNLASKRQSAQRKAALQRRARQLSAEGVSIEEIIRQLTPDAGKIEVTTKTVQRWIRRK